MNGIVAVLYMWHVSLAGQVNMYISYRHVCVYICVYLSTCMCVYICVYSAVTLLELMELEFTLGHYIQDSQPF